MKTTSAEQVAVGPLRVEEVMWIEPSQHHSAYSKLLVNPDSCATNYFDFRLSLYQPKGYVEEHVHERAEHVYYILQGSGLMKLDERQYVVGPHTAIFIPPGVVHSLANTGLENLLFIVVTVPAGELSMSDNWASKVTTQTPPA
jgi:mannose-6-phosphate isomerase-like protein (cupin superfamily)